MGPIPLLCLKAIKYCAFILPGSFEALSKHIHSQEQAGVLLGWKACRRPVLLGKILIHAMWMQQG